MDNSKITHRYIFYERQLELAKKVARGELHLWQILEEGPEMGENIARIETYVRIFKAKLQLERKRKNLEEGIE